MSINAVDVILILVILVNLLNGYRRGFIRGVLDLLGWTLAFIAGLLFYRPVAHWLSLHFTLWSDVWNQPVAFVLVALATWIAVHLIGELLFQRLPRKVDDRTLNRIFGLLPGFANGCITAAILSAVLLAMPLSETLRESARSSSLANYLAVYAERFEAALHPVFGEAIAKTLNLLTVEPESNERVELPFTVNNARPRPDLEAKMLELVNKERVSRGLKPLVADPELTVVARAHSADMFSRGYFAHDTPEGRDPFDRMREANVRFNTAGENLALAPTLQIAHTGLMNSPGHRANILHADFGRVGIGILDGGIRGLMVSQEFRN